MESVLDSILAFGFLGSIDFKSRDQNTPLKIKNAWVLPRLLFASSKERQCNRGWYFLSPSHKPSLPKRSQAQTQSTEQPFGLEMPDATTCTKPNKTLRPTEKMFSTLLTFQKVVDTRMQKVCVESKQFFPTVILKGTGTAQCHGVIQEATQQ